MDFWNVAQEILTEAQFAELEAWAEFYNDANDAASEQEAEMRSGFAPRGYYKPVKMPPPPATHARVTEEVNRRRNALIVADVDDGEDDDVPF